MCNVTLGKVNDIKGFFKTYHEIKLENFTNLFGNVSEHDIQALDYCLSDIYGSRCLQGRFSDIYNNMSADDCMARIVTIADKLYYENWINTKHAIEKASLTDLDKPLTSEKTGENTTKNKVNAFDSETASDSDNSTHNYSETTRYSNGKTVTQNAKTQIDFTRNNDFLEIIMNDILSVCCLSVYDDSYHPYRVSGGGETDLELEERVTQCETDIRGIKKLIPATATEQNKLATIADVQSGYDDTELRGKIEENTKNIQGIYNGLTDYATKTELQAVENKFSVSEYLLKGGVVCKQGKVCTIQFNSFKLDRTYSINENIMNIENQEIFPRSSVRFTLIQLNTLTVKEFIISPDGNIKAGQTNEIEEGYWVGFVTYFTT